MMEVDSITFKNCPFCNCPPRVTWDQQSADGRLTVQCIESTCPILVKYEAVRKTKLEALQEAAKKWNTRPGDDTLNANESGAGIWTRPMEVTVGGHPEANSQLCMWECREVSTQKRGEAADSICTLVVMNLVGVVNGEGSVEIQVRGNMEGQFRVGAKYLFGAKEPGV